MFKGIMFYECKDFLLTNATRMKPDIITDTKSHFEISFKKGSRKVNIALIHHIGYPIDVDITDSYYMIRIPRKSFKKKEKFQEFILKQLQNIAFTLQI
jgi:hypothetical protein